MDSTIHFLPGRSIVIFMPNGEQHKGRFSIAELSDITASHNEKNFSPSHGYPVDREGKNINDRNYADDKQAQAEVKIVAQHLNPQRILSTAPDESGSPVITQTGIVISGNNRTMSLKLAAADFPENYEHYKKILREELPAFGIETKDFDARQFSQPVLVRIDYDITDPTTADLSKFNKDTKKTERPIDIALKLRKMLADSDRCMSVISDIVKNYETFSEFRANFNDEKKLRDTLLECNIMVRQEMNRYWYERGFTDEGMDLLENMLSGIILEPDALRAGMESGVKQMRNILIVSLPVLIKNKTLPKKYSLISVINKAIILEAKIQASGLIRTDYLVQEKLFDEKPDIDTVYMNALLHEGRNKFKDAIERYNTSADAALIGNMFGDAPEPEQMFDVFIKRSVPELEVKVIERYFGKQEHITETPVPVAPAQQTLSEKVKMFMRMLQGPELAMQSGGALNGRAKNMSMEDIAALHKVPVKQIREQLSKGMNVELEQTSDLATAKQIAKDHLVESPAYYDKLKEMEETFAKGGNINGIEKLIRENTISFSGTMYHGEGEGEGSGSDFGPAIYWAQTEDYASIFGDTITKALIELPSVLMVDDSQLKKISKALTGTTNWQENEKLFLLLRNKYGINGINHAAEDDTENELADWTFVTKALLIQPQMKQGGSIEIEIEQEKQNIDAAISAALKSEDHYFEGISLSQLKEDKVLLETDPRKYFLHQSGRMFKQAIDPRLSEEDRLIALQVGREYNLIFNMLMQHQIKSAIIKNEAGGEACNVCEHDNAAPSLAHGGIVEGKRHSQGGEKFNLDGQGQRVELEAGEPVVPEQLLNDHRQYTLTGTNRQVLNKILGMAGVSLNDKVTQVKSGDVVICRLSANDDAPRKYTGTLRQIVSAVNTSSGQCNMVEPGAKVQELQPA